MSEDKLRLWCASYEEVSKYFFATTEENALKIGYELFFVDDNYERKDGERFFLEDVERLIN